MSGLRAEHDRSTSRDRETASRVYLSRQCDRSCEPFGRSGLLGFADRADSGGRLAVVAEIEDGSVVCLTYVELKVGGLGPDFAILALCAAIASAC